MLGFLSMRHEVYMWLAAQSIIISDTRCIREMSNEPSKDPIKGAYSSSIMVGEYETFRYIGATRNILNSKI